MKPITFAKFALTCLALLTVLTVSAQNAGDLTERIQAIHNNGVDFYNVDGYEISTMNTGVNFTKANIVRKFKKYSIHEKDLTTRDSLLEVENYYVYKSREEPAGIITNTSYYFMKDEGDKLTCITFNRVNRTDRTFERTFLKVLLNNEIPRSAFHALSLDTINFVGRKITLGPSCHWMGVNNVQCPRYGQMNWGMHKDLAEAKQTVDQHLEIIKGRKGGKVVSDADINILFEGEETKARKVIYDFTGVKSALVGFSGGKTLTIYFVAAHVRNRFVSCVMSHWDNDSVRESGLPPLLEEVMKIQL